MFGHGKFEPTNTDLMKAPRSNESKYARGQIL